MLSLTNGTLLELIPQDGLYEPQLSPFAARGLTQTLELLGQSQQTGTWLRRDVNGTLQSLADTRFRKYRSTITCKDGETACVDNAWIGHKVLVNCCCELSLPGGAPIGRTPVSGSVRSQAGFNYYRPALTMLVTAIRFGFQEYPALYDWQIDLEEV